MLRVVPHQSAAAARQYYAEGLRREDYYSEGQEVAGKWHGKAARLLGLSGQVTPDAFALLVENRHPKTGERLTPRNKADRIVGYDLNFHAPKSLSVLHAFTGDDDLLKAFRSAVAETMGEIEALTSTRVRQRGAQENRVTGNLAWAEFVHFTARPVNGKPDPHLHVHCFAFNATFDGEEGRWKAAKFRDIKRDAPYSEAAFRSRLSAKVAALGYGIERTAKGWEITGIPRPVIDRFSRRTAEIEKLAEKKGITDAKAKDALGASSREGKRHGVAYKDLVAEWASRISSDEMSRILEAKTVAADPDRITATAALDYAEEKLFAKNSVVEVKRLVSEAMRYGVGHTTPARVWEEFGRREMIVRQVGDDRFCTSLGVLAEEVALINFVRAGRNMCARFEAGTGRSAEVKLSAEQKAAVQHILRSRDQVMAIRGGAGVGKTTLMKEAVGAIEAGGLKVFAFAPSAAASRETLREAGFVNAQTVAHLLSNTKLQQETRGHVIWIDEAGLLGVRDMWQIMQIAGQGTRVILTGDTAQHAPVARGDAFRLLQKYAGLRVAEVTQIRRQEQALYREAVSALSQGDLRTGFRRLDDLGAIMEVPDEAERYRMLANDFIDLSRGKSVPLVVSPTHAEAAKVTDAIRQARFEAGQLKGERSFLRWHNLQWEEADRKRSENYREGHVVQFHQNAPGVKRGELFHVKGRDEQGGVRAVAESGREITLPLQDASRFLVYEAREIQIARGDRIRITRNGETADGRRINNGNVFTVQSFKRDGSILLTTGAVLKAEHGHLAHGYCQTSHSSQSKSVRDVLVAQSAESFLAASREQFYVSVSRAKETIRIYTDDRRGLQQAVGNSSLRKSGVELAGLSSREVSSLMGATLDSKQWKDWVRNHAPEGQKKSFQRTLQNQRKTDGLKKTDGMNWEAYVKMRRAISGPDGKSRSKGHPSTVMKKGGSQQAKGRSFARPTQPRVPHNQTPTKGPKPAPQKATVKDRAAKAVKTAGQNFKKVGPEMKRVKNSAGNKLPKPSVKAVASHRAKQRGATAVDKAKTMTKTQTKAKVQAPPPPTPKKGR